MKYKVTLNKKIYEVEVTNGEAILAAEYDAVAAPAPAPAAPAAPAAAPDPAAAPVATAEGERVLSQLPGTVLAVKVNVGDVVKAGDVVAVVEAMKMENDMVAPCDGTVKQVVVKKGDNVASGAVLAVLG